MKRYLFWIVVLVMLSLLLSGCAPGMSGHSEKKPAGFWWGLWHGLISLISLIWHWFNPKVHLYESFNTGWWYDLGFFLGIVIMAGGGASRRKHR